MKKLLLVVTLGVSATALTAAEQKRYYVPLVLAETGREIIPGATPEDTLLIQTLWMGNISAFNTSNVMASVTPTAVYGGFVVRPGSHSIGLDPGTGDQFVRWPYAGFAGPSNGPVGFAELVADPGIVVNAGVEKAQYCSGCPIPDRVNQAALVSQGRSAIPVFEELFPAGRSVICGEVNLGAPRQICGKPANQQYPRRVNVTLFNAGSAPATFKVEAIPLYTDPDPIFSQTVTVAAKDVIQLNDVPIPRIENGHMTVDFDVYVWIRIHCDQPFLAYASSIFEGGATGSMPFEVFTPRLAAETGP